MTDYEQLVTALHMMQFEEWAGLDTDIPARGYLCHNSDDGMKEVVISSWHTVQRGNTGFDSCPMVS